MRVRNRVPGKRYASVVAAMVVGVAAAVFAGTTPAWAAYQDPPESTQFAQSTQPQNWNAPPAGANIPCVPSSAHPNPVVLAEGTFANMYNSFGALAADLANQGYCVYAFNYGQTIKPSMFYAMGDIAQSASELSTEVDTVLAQTGASKVDIVGWSQGGMMPRYYINSLGGASKVDKLVGLAPSNYGTTVDGFTTLINNLQQLGLNTSQLTPGCPACSQQFQGSSFLKALNANPTVPGVQYVVIATNQDHVVTPYTNAFLPAASNVQNITLQNQCPQDYGDHTAIPYDSNAIADVLNALGPNDPNFVPNCKPVSGISGNE